MKVKNYLMLVVFMFFGVTLTLAQEKMVTGTVSNEEGLPLPGVNH
ncbi:hypothetical protein [Gillisia marina]|nr:hypothetical protein [Gillisia marina]